MKTMSCRQLGGACDHAFYAETFDEIAEQSKKHGLEMFRSGDEPHLKAMSEIQKRMQSPESMAKWLESKRKEFDALPDLK